MYTTETTQNYIANRIQLAQSTTGAPLNILNLPVSVVATSGYPADFTFTDANENIVKALCVVEVKSSETKRLTGPRVKLTQALGQLDPVNLLPIAGYINPTNAGFMQQMCFVEVMVLTQGRTMQQAQSLRNQIMDGIATLLQTEQLGPQLTDPVTGMKFELQTLGERIQRKAELTERTENETIFISSGHVFLPDMLITYFI